MAALQSAAAERSNREIELTDEARIEIAFENQCLNRGFATASVRLDAMRLRVAEKLRASGQIPMTWVV